MTMKERLSVGKEEHLVEQEGTNESATLSPRTWMLGLCRLHSSILSPDLSYISSLFLPRFSSIAVGLRLSKPTVTQLTLHRTVSPARAMARGDVSAIRSRESPSVRLAHRVAV